MNKDISLNLLTVVPFALWGYIARGLSRTKNIPSSEWLLDIGIISIFVYLIIVIYYILLILYLKKGSTSNVKYQKYCVTCLVIGFAFLISFLVF